VLPAVSTRPALAAAAYVAPSVLTAVGQDDGPSGLRRLGALVTLLLLTLIAAAAIATGVWWAVHAVA
jgi:hypothetical protein